MCFNSLYKLDIRYEQEMSDCLDKYPSIPKCWKCSNILQAACNVRVCVCRKYKSIRGVSS